jgi:gamma-glutamyl:cysteine ligase YbdK (ATP-grasp superfamily)
MNAVRYFIPHIFALYKFTFWFGRNTGYKSYCVKVFDKFTHRHPDYLKA